MFHLHLAIEQDKLQHAVAVYQQKHRVQILGKVRSQDAQGRCVCEISVGRATMEHPVTFWVDHLKACLASVEHNNAEPQ